MTGFRACAGGAGIFGTVSRGESAGRCLFFSPYSLPSLGWRVLVGPFLTPPSPVLIPLPCPSAPPVDLPFNLPTLAGAPPKGFLPHHTPHSRRPHPGLAPPRLALTPGDSPHARVLAEVATDLAESYTEGRLHTPARPGLADSVPGDSAHLPLCTSCSPATTGVHL